MSPHLLPNYHLTNNQQVAVAPGTEEVVAAVGNSVDD